MPNDAARLVEGARRGGGAAGRYRWDCPTALGKPEFRSGPVARNQRGRPKCVTRTHPPRRDAMQVQPNACAFARASTRWHSRRGNGRAPFPSDAADPMDEGVFLPHDAMRARLLLHGCRPGEGARAPTPRCLLTTHPRPRSAGRPPRGPLGWEAGSRAGAPRNRRRGPRRSPLRHASRLTAIFCCTRIQSGTTMLCRGAFTAGCVTPRPMRSGGQIRRRCALGLLTLTSALARTANSRCRCVIRPAILVKP